MTTLRDIEEERAALIAAVNAYCDARAAQARARGVRRVVVREPANDARAEAPETGSVAEARATSILQRHGLGG